MKVDPACLPLQGSAAQSPESSKTPDLSPPSRLVKHTQEIELMFNL